ncbi:MAG: high-potential iron-sulfur protein [Gammaproteobacteria bacterium]|nr:high-potential iron-sulfur protein [Gammaproteobacteria bacterium]
MNKNLTRRKLLQTLAVALPAGAVLVNQTALAEDAPKLDPNDPTAKALLYVEDVSTLDKSSPAAARYEASQKCANCIQIAGEDGAAYRPCNIFPGKVVAAEGWCSVWAPKP